MIKNRISGSDLVSEVHILGSYLVHFFLSLSGGKGTSRGLFASKNTDVHAFNLGKNEMACGVVTGTRLPMLS